MQYQEKLTTLTRVGFAARGLLYLVIAWLVIATGQAADLSEALEQFSSGAERWLLALAAAGFVAYGLWRLADASLDTENHGDDPKGLVKRAGAAGSGVIYLFLAFTAAKLLLNGPGGGGGGGGSPQEQTEMVMQLPAGGLLVGLGAAVLVIAGIWQIVKAVKASFLDHFEPAAAREDWVKWLGRFGYAARGVIFIVTGYFLARAALTGSSAQAGGMEQALQWLSSPVNLLVAAGLGLFGIFSLVEARYRMIHAPDRSELPG